MWDLPAEGIPIEERDPDEVLAPRGCRLALADAPVWNPAFDVTPAELVGGIIAERGVARPPYRSSLAGLVHRERL